MPNPSPGSPPPDFATHEPLESGGPLRIALLTYSTKPRGGVVHTLALAEALARAGQDVTVWSLAFPSAKEGFGLAAMEALTARRSAGCLRPARLFREIFDGAACFATTPAAFAAGLGQALTRPDAGQRAAGRDLAARHTWSAAASRHLRFYHSLTPQAQAAPELTGAAFPG
jgi:hypothetical protein